MRLSEYQGKVILVDIFGTWCKPCRKVIPHLVNIQNRYSSDLQVIGLCKEQTTNVQMAQANLKTLIGEARINYPCGLIDDRTLSMIPKFSGFPTLIFIDRSGNVRNTVVGSQSESQLEAMVVELIREPRVMLTGGELEAQPRGRIAGGESGTLLR